MTNREVFVNSYWEFLSIVLPLLLWSFFIAVIGLLVIIIFVVLAEKWGWFKVREFTFKLFKKQWIVFLGVWGINLLILICITFLSIYTLLIGIEIVKNIYDLLLIAFAKWLSTVVITIGYVQLVVFSIWNFILGIKIKYLQNETD